MGQFPNDGVHASNPFRERRLRVNVNLSTGQKSRCGEFGIRRIRGEQILANGAAFPDFQKTRFSVVRSEARGPGPK
jgi:hypothetical protein